MLVFDGLIYLDVQKTGSTFVTAFLRACCRRPERRYHQHGQFRWRLPPDALRIVSVREPLGAYLSLYRSGHEERGGLFHRLRQAELTEVYQGHQDGLDDFVDLLLEPMAAAVLHPDYPGIERRHGVGFQTFRHLLLALQWPTAVLAKARPGTLPQIYEDRRLWTERVRQEHLAEDLLDIARRHPDHLSLDAAQDFIAANSRINASTGPRLAPQLTQPTLRRMLRKERLIYERFYPERLASLEAEAA